MWDYDIAIVGATFAGVKAAASAARWGARVALVGPRTDPWVPPAALAPWNEYQGAVATAPVLAVRQQARAVRAWARETDPVLLANLGVDWLSDPGVFRLQCLQVGNRVVRARRYLLTPPLRARLPPIAGLTAAAVCLPSAVPERAQTAKTWIILGGDPDAIAWAQQLARWGKVVVLVAAGERLLPDWFDRAASNALQRILEADRVRVRLGTAVRHLHANPDGSTTVQVEGATWSSDAVLVADGAQPDWGTWNLAVAGIGNTTAIPPLDRYLRAENRRIAVCRTWLGGDRAARDAEIALHNALKPVWPRKIERDDPVPRWLGTQPEAIALGLTAARAERRWPGQILAHTRPLALQPEFVCDARTSGLCTLVARRDGYLLGVQILAPGARDLAATAGLALQRPARGIARLATLPVPELSHTQLLVATARQWQQANGRLAPLWRRWFS